MAMSLSRLKWELWASPHGACLTTSTLLLGQGLWGALSLQRLYGCVLVATRVVAVRSLSQRGCVPTVVVIHRSVQLNRHCFCKYGRSGKEEYIPVKEGTHMAWMFRVF